MRFMHTCPDHKFVAVELTKHYTGRVNVRIDFYVSQT